MRRLVIMLTSSLLGLLLAACQSGAPAVSPTAPPAPTEPLARPAPLSTPAQAAVGQASCTVASLLPTPNPAEDSPFPAASAEEWALGDEDALVTIIEYGDFQ